MSIIINRFIILKKPDMEIVRINNNLGKKYKSFLLFGEHPRELITTETSLRLLEKLCNNQENPKIKNILD